MISFPMEVHGIDHENDNTIMLVMIYKLLKRKEDGSGKNV